MKMYSVVDSQGTAFILHNGLEMYWKASTLPELKFSVKINITYRTNDNTQGEKGERE